MAAPAWAPVVRRERPPSGSVHREELDLKTLQHWIAAVAVTALLSACGGGGGADTPPASGNSGAPARALASHEPVGTQCATAGARIDAGLDRNGNGTLDADEIASTQYVCHGNSGLTALVQMRPEPAGAHCAAGGTRVEAGADGSADGVLDAAELTSVAYVCDGAAGATGATGAAGQTGAAGVAGAVGGTGAAGAAGATGATGAAGADGLAGLDTLMSMAVEAPGANCAAGGSLIQSGIDSDRNGALGVSEVTATRLVCHGSNGAAGSDGSSSLLAIVVEAAGANCAAGGRKMTSGRDSNGNGQLDAGEVASTAYTCHGLTGAAGATGAMGAPGAAGTAGATGATGATGTTGATGAAGAAGSNGTAGTNGSNGSNGYTTLTASTAEAAGANCSAGGMKITSGVDASRDGVLDAIEVNATSYVCNGLAAIGWIDVVGNSMQAVSNTGYVASHAAQVTVTLPPNPAIGDTVRVSGAGAGGWRIAQNAGQAIVTANIDAVTLANSWVAAATPAQDWRGVATSADGKRLVAVPYNGEVVTSSDGGLTWLTTGLSGGWTAVASSADGRRLVVAGYNEQLRVSGDYGDTWTLQESSRPWTSVASSANGRVLVAAAVGSQIFVSTDYGNTWSARFSGANWTGVAISADGSRLIAAAHGAGVYGSTDGGLNWVTHMGGGNFKGVASSASGQWLSAVDETGYVYSSNDYGNAYTWYARDAVRTWSAVSVSADGRHFAATTIDDIVLSSSIFVYLSSDHGENWTPRGPSDAWNSVALSADGSRVFASSSSYYGSGSLWTSAPTRATSTTPGSGGWIVGRQHQAIELQYIGAGQFLVLGAIGSGFGVQ